MIPKMQQNKIRISVRNLVEFVLQTGDIDNRRGGNEKDAMQEGSRVHRQIQARQGKKYPDYQAEVSLKIETGYHQVVICLEGRADGVFTDEDGVTTVEEIKGMYIRVAKLEEPIAVHEAQAMCYAYILSVQRQLPSVRILMTYQDLITEETNQFVKEYTADQLQLAYDSLISSYGRWADYLVEHRAERTRSIKGMEFPFPYREGQRDVVVSAYKTMAMGKTLFVQAPTGIGKTLSTVFPAIKAMGEGYADKIFYMTAKTITRGVAREAFDLMKTKGLKAGCITLTAKEKICLQAEEEGKAPDCNPVACPYAKGHFDRVNDAVYDMITNEDNVTRETILAYAKKHMVCPFEMSLDVTNWMDMIICDYNYVFDPHAKLQRYFGEGAVDQDFIFLVDEAHNLADRAREMYSAAIYKEDFEEAARHYETISRRLSNDCRHVSQVMLDLKRDLPGDYMVLEQGDLSPLYSSVLKFYTDYQKYEDDHPEFSDRDFAPFFFAVRDFVNVYDNYDRNYRIYAELEPDGRFKVKLLCVMPASQLNACLDRGSSAIFFSATMLPMRFYKELLRGNNEDYAIYVRSPFDTGKRLIAFATDVTSKYTRRNTEEYMKVVEYLLKIVNSRYGNYMAFFPSFAYMDAVYELLCELEPDCRIICQESGMREEERENFLKQFETAEEGRSLLGMCVTGGIFGEGIDLTQDKLIGVIVVGCGLPQICPEREVIRKCIEETGTGDGYAYSYQYPGMNRILQAAGRLIRTQEDCGVIVMLDYRFLNASYRRLFPEEWAENRIVVDDSAALEQEIWKFWDRMEQ